MKRLFLIMAFAGLATLALTGVEAGADAMNSNTRILLPLELYIQTDKAVYNPGDTVEILFRVTNLGNMISIFEEPVEFYSGPSLGYGGDIMFTFGSSMLKYFTVTASDGSVIWDTSHGIALDVMTGFALHIGEYREFTMSWELMANNGSQVDWLDDHPVTPGIYDITSSLKGYDTPVSVPITVIPEPATTALLGLGLLGVLLSKKRQ